MRKRDEGSSTCVKVRGWTKERQDGRASRGRSEKGTVCGLWVEKEGKTCGNRRMEDTHAVLSVCWQCLSVVSLSGCLSNV